MDKHKEIREAAHRHCNAGHSILPVAADKKPLVEWKQYQKRRATHDEISAWFARWPDMGFGIVTGAISGIAVVDVEAGGSTAGFTPTATARTGGGGWHLYYKHPGKEVKNATRMTELTDIRGDGGYVIAPPSVSDKGEYSWAFSIWDGELAEYPEEYIASLQKPMIATQTTPHSKIPVGERNDAATRYVGRILAALPSDIWETGAWGALKELNATLMEIPLPEQELRSVYESIRDRAAASGKENKEEISLEPFTLTTLYDEKFPDFMWLAEDLIPLGGITGFTGDSNTYKSFLTVALAISVATGQPFLGHFKTVKGKVLIIDEENHRSYVRKRFEELGMEKSENILFLSQNSIKLDKEKHVDALKELLEKERPALVIFDALVRFHDKEENDASQMSKIMHALRQMTGDDRAILFIHHHRKQQGFARKSEGQSVRGSGDIFASLDCHIAVDRKGQEKEILMSQHKLRIQRQLLPFKVALLPTEDGKTSFVYQGEDTSRQERVTEIAEQIKEMLAQAEEPLPRKAIQSSVDTSKGITNEALKMLMATEEIVASRGKHGAHHFGLPSSEEEMDDAEEELEASF